MERFVKGDVVVVAFPFSDLSASKRRPALVLSNIQSEDALLCQITSQDLKDQFSISLNQSDFLSGGLSKISNIRLNRIFTASKSIVLYKAGSISSLKQSEVRNGILSILDQ